MTYTNDLLPKRTKSEAKKQYWDSVSQAERDTRGQLLAEGRRKKLEAKKQTKADRLATITKLVELKVLLPERAMELIEKEKLL